MATSALRFWEAKGLIRPTFRTSSGYRRYDAESVARVRFIMRAQALGLSLTEIGELLSAADGVGEEAVCEQLRHFLTHKLSQTRHQVEELNTFAAQLERVWIRLGENYHCGCRHLGECSCLPPQMEPSEQTRLISEIKQVDEGSCGAGINCDCAS